MTSYLIDFILMAALVFTSWRTGAMYRELRRLRSEETNFAQGLKNAEEAINRAAHAVVMLRSEGVQTLRALEAATLAAQETTETLEEAVHRAGLRLAVANDADKTAPTSENWLSLIESRLASASTANR